MTNSSGPQRRPIRRRARDRYQLGPRIEHLDRQTLRILSQWMWAHILFVRCRHWQAGFCADIQTTCWMLPAGGIFATEQLDFDKVENTLFQHMGSRAAHAGALPAPILWCWHHLLRHEVKNARRTGRRVTVGSLLYWCRLGSAHGRETLHCKEHSSAVLPPQKDPDTPA